MSSVGDVEPPTGMAVRLHTRMLALPPTVRGMLWMVASGLVFTFLNTAMRATALVVDPFEVQFLRYVCGLAVMLPLVLRAGVTSFAPNGVAGQIWRGAVHTSGLTLWFMALPHIPLATATAIGFTSPIFIMIGAALVLKERMVPARWLAAAIGFAGVLVVVGPRADGASYYNLIMLGSAPLFAASFLITKALSRRDRPEVIVVWQSLTVSAFTLPMAVFHWTWPTPALWAVFVACGILGSAGHYCMTRAFRAADISATQSVKFLDLIWTSIAGFLVFSDVPSLATVIGAGIIFVSTTWITRREARA